MRLILASSSERRAELFSWLGIPFEVLVSDVDESSIEERHPWVLVKRLALAKAQAVADRLQQSGVPERLRSGTRSSQKGETVLVVGADTVVRVDGEIIGKPTDRSDAVRILGKLSGKTHTVYTGVAVVDASTLQSVVDVEQTRVTFRTLATQEIADYVASGEPLDKGGGYAIQMGAAGFVTQVVGSYTNVVGLPLLLLTKLMEAQGLHLDRDVSQLVREKTGHES